MSVEQLAEVGLAQPAVDARAHLHAHGLGNDRRVAEPRGEIDLAESAFANQALGPISKLGFRTLDDLPRLRAVDRRGALRCGAIASYRVVDGPGIARHWRRSQLSPFGCFGSELDFRILFRS